MDNISPQKFEPEFFDNAERACERIREIYDAGISYLRNEYRSFVAGEFESGKVCAYYPYIKLIATNSKRSDTRLSFGFVPKIGTYTATLTAPEIFHDYYREQIELLLSNHGIPIEIGVSNAPIPIHFALDENFCADKALNTESIQKIPDIFDVPEVNEMNDATIGVVYPVEQKGSAPLSLFPAQRVDLSLLRLKHYTATSAKHFQHYIIFTNYQFYIDEFIKICRNLMSPNGDKVQGLNAEDYTEFVEPGNRITANRNYKSGNYEDDEGMVLQRQPQMPAYHLKRADGSGITMINIGVGPSNAKTITDHISVLRPHAWVMLGHCAGLRNSQNVGDYVLAHGYLRQDNVMYHDLHPSIPVPALSEIQSALEEAVSQITGYEGYDLKKIMRTGTVATIDDRNWELKPSKQQMIRFSQSRAIALDMESGTIAANGFRFRVPYGTLLCVSDKPLHGQLKLPGMADAFYRERVEQHLKIGLLAMTYMRKIGADKLHSRKLRSFDEVAFR